MFNIIHFDEINSTNTYAKINIDRLHHFDVIQADYQSQGRGRKNHQWYSLPKQNLMASLIIKDKIEATTIHQITQVTALSIVKVCQEQHLYPKIKFPNDIYIKDKKLAGILVEAIFSPNLKGIVIGTGINVRENPLVETSTSLFAQHCQLSVEEVLERYLYYFNIYYGMFKRGQYQKILDEVNDLSYLKDKQVFLDNKQVYVGRLLYDGRIEIFAEDKKDYIYVNEFSLSKSK